MARLEALELARPRLAEVGLSLPQFGLLISVWREPGLRVHEVAEKLGVTTPTVSVALRKLEKDGWLERKPDPQDRRSAQLFLSEKASLLARQVSRHRRKQIGEFMNGLSAGEQDQLLSLLEKAITNLEEKRISKRQQEMRQ